jgi:hypothetical protein
VLLLDPAPLLGRQEGDLGVAGDLGQGAGLVDQYQLVGVGGVGEEEVDPLLLHHPADEVEVRLPVLHQVVPGAVVPHQLDVDRQLVLEQLLEDVGDLLLLEDAAVRGVGQQRQLGAQGRSVAHVAVGGAEDPELGADPVEVALPRLVLDGDRHLLAEQRLQVDLARLAQHVDLVAEGPPELFLAGHPLEQQRLGRWWGGDPNLAVELHFARCSISFDPAGDSRPPKG